MKLILASSSPRRKRLMKRLNCSFDIIFPDVDESKMKFESSPEKYCISLAELKADNVSQDYPNALVIGADTIVVLDDHIMNKPHGHDEAEEMLHALSGKIHEVHTGVCIKSINDNIQHSFSEVTQVNFQKLTNQEIRYYVKIYLPFDKAGAYGIQDWSSIFVEQINGCYDNVVGFPLSRFYLELKKLDINLLDTISESY